MSDGLKVVVFKEAEQWVAQCLDHDVCVQGPDLETVRSRMHVALTAEDDLESLPKAPEHFFKLWDRKSGFSENGRTDGMTYEMALCA
ncbi:hypothetical protein EDE08_102580 [Bradyrhizobium sp. R2.2-H]|jgi:hypothetical protein|uniref:hypothetical protein n=1 Tax=unclassified Bradyrhizobium TaxID=2631580 RepID=UPI0010478336|nr:MULTISPECIES: hypothetical protein [unclassified Bradyrhizobium]TCU77036.1 hypothetical protein EDE10_102580 [Bradyrhizobium sp. Y-H1]TCU80109.1 hypothetical protein EDE08_102580 [Bradyrhizobium sp. R2.2-H]